MTPETWRIHLHDKELVQRFICQFMLEQPKLIKPYIATPPHSYRYDDSPNMTDTNISSAIKAFIRNSVHTIREQREKTRSFDHTSAIHKHCEMVARQAQVALNRWRERWSWTVKIGSEAKVDNGRYHDATVTVRHGWHHRIEASGLSVVGDRFILSIGDIIVDYDGYNTAPCLTLNPLGRNRMETKKVWVCWISFDNSTKAALGPTQAIAYRTCRRMVIGTIRSRLKGE